MFNSTTPDSLVHRSRRRSVLAVQLLVAVALTAGATVATASGADAKRPEPGSPSPGAADLFTPPVTTEATWTELRAIAASDGTVPVIVALDAPSKRPHELTAGQHGQQNAAIARVSGKLVRELGGRRVKNLRQLDQLPLLTLDADLEVLDALEKSKHVRSVSLDRELEVEPRDTVPDDHAPSSASSPATVEADSAVPAVTSAVTSWNGAHSQLTEWWHWDQMGLNRTYQVGYRGAGQTIAVIDSGVERSHSWLAGSVVAEACFVSTSRCPNGNWWQYGNGAGRPCTFHAECAHGTHVAHTAAGTWGAAPDAKIVAIRAADRGSDGKPAYRESNLVWAMWYVYNSRSSHRYAAVNLSVGGGYSTGTCDGATLDGSGAYLTGYVDLLKSVGIATVIAAGNDGRSSAVSFPGCISSAVTVGNTTYVPSGGYRYDAVYSGSNSSWVVDLLAPGTDICSAVPGNRVQCWWIGTSMAAPQVAGAFAVLKAKRPHATVEQIRSQLIRTGRAVTDSRNGITRSRIDVYGAVSSF